MSLASLKKKSADASSIDRLRESLNPKTAQKTIFNDDTYWRPTLDQESGTGYAVIRFMPEPEGEDFARVQYWEHSFTGKTGKKYYARSLTSIGLKDPVGELNSRLWNSGVESDKDIARAQKRKARYVSNIYVIDDPAHPENNGQVKRFIYGEKIWQMLEGKISPEFKTDKPVNPFDFWTGCNVVLKIRILKTGDQAFWNYDKSVIEDSSAFLGGDEAKLNEVYSKLHSLKELLDPKHFGTYEKLQSRLLEVVGPISGSGVPTVVGATQGSTAIERAVQTPVVVKPPVEVDTPVQAAGEVPVTASTAPAEDEDDEEYFRKLMQEK